jgi:hypothetical protein
MSRSNGGLVGCDRFLQKKLQHLRSALGAMKPLDHVVDEKLQPGQGSKAMFSSKKIQDFSSHRIFGHVYGALNVDKKKLITQFGRKNHETNLLNIISP